MTCSMHDAAMQITEVIRETVRSMIALGTMCRPPFVVRKTSSVILADNRGCGHAQVTRARKVGRRRMQECFAEVQDMPVVLLTGAGDRCVAIEMIDRG